MLTQTHVASSCGLVSVARARRGEGGCGAGVHSVCPRYTARHVAGFLLTQAAKGKLFLLGKFCFSLTLSQGPLLLAALDLHKTSSPCSIQGETSLVFLPVECSAVLGPLLLLG